MAKTPNHDYNAPEKGTENWDAPLNENFEAFDADIEVRDVEEQRKNYIPKQGAKFLATDTGKVFVGDGSEWQAVLALPRIGGTFVPGTAGNIVNGHSNNIIGDGVSGATIGGGGTTDKPNGVMGRLGTVGGGWSCFAHGEASTVGGGQLNQAIGKWATVGGGASNVTDAEKSTIGGGGNNRAREDRATVGGGDSNHADGGGATVAGGTNNSALAGSSTVAGGAGNNATANNAAVGGGNGNTARGNAATVPGGLDNEAVGPYSFAAGRQAKATHAGAFVWSDNIAGPGFDPFESNGENTWSARCTGGARFVTAFTGAGGTQGVSLNSGSGSWSSLSAREAKEDVRPVDPGDVLDRVESLPISRWRYRSEDGVEHMGPMAEAFHDAFGLGPDNEHITGVDADGVALAAIQSLARRLDERDRRIAALEARLDDQATTIERLRPGMDPKRLATLEARLDALESRATSSAHCGGPDEEAP